MPGWVMSTGGKCARVGNVLGWVMSTGGKCPWVGDVHGWVMSLGWVMSQVGNVRVSNVWQSLAAPNV